MPSHDKKQADEIVRHTLRPTVTTSQLIAQGMKDYGETFSVFVEDCLWESPTFLALAKANKLTRPRRRKPGELT